MKKKRKKLKMKFLYKLIKSKSIYMKKRIDVNIINIIKKIVLGSWSFM